MRAARLLGLRKFFNNIHFSSCIVLKKSEKYSITSKTWYDFCGLRNFSDFSIKMSIEPPVAGESAESEMKAVNGMNGVSNGYSTINADNNAVKEKSKSSSSGSHHHKSSSKDKHRDKDRDRSRDHKSSKSSHTHSSSSKSKHSSSHGSSSKDKHRDKEKHSSSSHKSSNKDKDRERTHDKDKQTSTNAVGETEKKSSSSSHDKNRSDRDKDKDRKKEHKSSSSRHDKDKDKGKDADKDKDKHKSSSSSSTKDKGHKSSSSSSKHHSSSSSKHRDKDRDKHRTSSSKSGHDKERRKEKESTGENGTSNIKNELPSPIKEDKLNVSDVSYSSNAPIYHNGIRDVKLEQECYVNMSQASSCDYSMSQFRPDESSFDIKSEAINDEDSQFGSYVTNDVQDDDPLRIRDARPDQDFSFGADQTNNIVVDDDDDDEEDIPIAVRKKVKREVSDEDEDDIPLTARKKIKTEKKAKKKKYESDNDDEDDYDEKPKKKKVKKEKKDTKPSNIKTEVTSPQKGRKKKEEEPQEVWKWWEEEKLEDGTKWKFLEHKGPVFAPPYEPLPDNVHFEYDGKVMKLSQDAEEIACFYAKMLEHEFTSKEAFNNNFFKDWRKSMTSKEREKITKLEKCNFRKMCAYFTAQSEKNKSRSKEEKLALKEENERLISEYGFCKIDGHREKIGNFKIEPPGLFRGRGEHPKMGLVKRRVMPEDILINCSKDSVIPKAPPGHRWKEVRHDNTVTWLASWTENVQGQVKYIMLNPSSKLKGEKDWQKYETARRLHKHIGKIRNTYREEWKSKEMRIRQRAVALYFIDKLALRAGNEKDEDQADTVGCCSLRVEHIELHKELNGKENVVVFDFLGKDSIRYYNEVEVEKRVFKNLELFKENKKEGDDLFDRLNTVVMNEHLRDLMDGLTAKVFRTYNASWTLQNQLNEMTDPDASLPEKLLAYNRANRAVAILCNHQRAVPKSHEKSMENLKEKIRSKREMIDDCEADCKELVKAAKRGSVKEKVLADKKKKQLEKLKEQLKKLELQETDRDENKTIALGTSKLNYLDPRISVAWCKKYDVPIDKIYNKTQRDKFRWAIDMATEDYEF